MHDKVIYLRPRLSFFEDIHPELYERFNQIPASRHNALVFQMLVKLEAIERYAKFAGVNLPQTDAEVRASIKEVKTAPVRKAEVVPIEKPPVQVHESGSNSEKSSILDLKDALGDLGML